jgi:phosphomannomutase
VAAALLLQLLLEEARPLSAVVAEYPRYAIVKDKLGRPAAPLDSVYAALSESFAGAESDRQDGLRLSWPDAWLHVRPSGTEPIVRVIAEAPTTERARELIGLARAPLERLGL